MTFVPLAAAHLDAILAIEAEAFAGRDPWSRSAFEHELLAPQSLWRVALEGEVVAGYAGGWVVMDELHILNLAIAAVSRRRGGGRALLGALLAAARERGCRRATLEVREANAPARALYESAGFRAEGRRARYYANGEDAVIYWKELAGS